MLKIVKLCIFTVHIVLGTAITGITANAGQLPRLAVSTFEAKGVPNGDAELISEAVATQAQRLNMVELLERSQMNVVLQEQGLQSSGICSEAECASVLGNILGVDFILAGTVGKIEGHYIVNLRIIHVTSGKVIGAASQTSRTGKMMSFITEQVPLATQMVFNNASSHLYTQSTRMQNTKTQNMVLIPAGSFYMGSQGGFSNASQQPVHLVKLDSFYMDATEVTQADYRQVTRARPSFNNCAQCPVEQVTWAQAKRYCELIGKRLPTEAEWEYAYRAGSSSEFPWGNEFLNYQPFIGTLSTRQPFDVGITQPNNFKLYDMAGNVSEWVQDWFDPSYYAQSPAQNPKGPAGGEKRVVRGGSYWGNPRIFAHGYRGYEHPAQRSKQIGFRCALSAGE
jgi:formylglycine-generating enzyme